MKRIGLRGVVILSCAATAVSAGPYDGIYKQAANAECALVGVDGGSVRIADGIFYGVEVQCRMDNPVNVLEMDALLYTMNCSDDDTQFSERAMLMNKAEGNGIIMVWDGYAFVYDRCPAAGEAAPPADGVAATSPVIAPADPAATPVDAPAAPAD